MNRRILANSNNKDADKENQHLGALIAIEVGRLMDAHIAQMPMNLVLTLSLDNARIQLWPRGSPSAKPHARAPGG